MTVGAHPARFGLPRPFLAFRRCSRVELAAYDVLEVRLVVGDTPVRSTSFLERLVAKPVTDTPTTPQVVASLPGGATWPTDPGPPRVVGAPPAGAAHRRLPARGRRGW